MAPPEFSPQRGVELVANLMSGQRPNNDQIMALLTVTAPDVSWRSYDQSIRNLAGPTKWQQASTPDADTAMTVSTQHEPEMIAPEFFWTFRLAVAQVLTSHPNGRVRLEAVRALQAARLPLPLVERALDWVPAVRDLAASALATRWQTHPSEPLGIVAADALLQRVAAVRRCPQVIPLAIDISTSRPSNGNIRTFWTHERRRRCNELLRNLRHVQCDPTRPEQESARDALLAFHESCLRSAS